MNRRSYLSTLAGTAGLTGGVVLAGCSAGRRPEDGIDVADATVERGDTTSVGIEAAGALRLRVTDAPGANGVAGEPPVEPRFGAADIDPEPARVWTVHPPTWEWRTARRVSVRLPVRARKDAAPGEHAVTVRWSDGETERTATGTLTVE